MERKKVALVTALHIPNGAKDTKPLLDSINKSGRTADLVIWNNPQVDWQQYDTVFLHTAWDYILHVEAFCKWIEQLDTHLSFINPTDLILWNIDKRYLLD